MFEAHFQTFEEPESGVALTARLSALREELARRKLTGFVVPRADQQQNEYVAPSEERLAWLTGFTGSAGLAIVLTQEAAMFVDGRYTLQAAKQVDGKAWSVEPLVDPPPESWLAKHLKAGDRLGFDPWLHTSAAAERLAAACAKAGAELVAVDSNPVDTVWTERPPPPLAPVAVHGPQFAGEAEADKLDAHPARDRQSSAPTRWCCRTATRWPGPSTSAAPTSRIRRCRCPTRWCRRTAGRPSSSITASSPTRPAIISSNPPTSREPDALTPRLTELAEDRRADRARQRHRRRCAEPPDHGAPAASRCAAAIPSALLKAVKNATEIEGTRTAHRRDAVALARFLAWVDREAPKGALTEIDAVEALETFRRDTGALKDVSFPTIAGTGPNGAIVHYRVTRKSNRRIAPGDLLLIDSGAQYEDGTTDVTRTIAIGEPTAEMRDRFTRVLRGHIAIARARIPGRHHRRAARHAGAAISVAGRHRFRARHRPRRRQLSLGA